MVSLLGFCFQDVLPIYINFESLLAESWERGKSLLQILSEAATLRWGSNPQGNPYVFINLPDMINQLSSEKKVAIIFADEVQELYKNYSKDLNKLNTSDRELIRAIGLSQTGGALVITSGSSSHLPSIISRSDNAPQKLKEFFPLIDNMNWNNGKHTPFRSRDEITKLGTESFLLDIVNLYHKKQELRKEFSTPNSKNIPKTLQSSLNETENETNLNNYPAGIELLEKVLEGKVPTLSLEFLFEITGGNLREIFKVLKIHNYLSDDKNREFFFRDVCSASLEQFNKLQSLTKDMIRIISQQDKRNKETLYSMSFEELMKKIQKDPSFKERCKEYEGLEKYLKFYIRQSIDEGLHYTVAQNNLIGQVSVPRKIWAIFAQAESEIDPEIMVPLLYPSFGGKEMEQKIAEMLCKPPYKSLQAKREWMENLH